MMRTFEKNTYQRHSPRLSLIVIFFVHILSSYGQVISTVIPSVDTTEMGDPITLNIRISIPENSTPKAISLKNWSSIENYLYQKDSIRYEATADIEILDGGTWNINDFNKELPFDLNKFTKENGQLRADFTIQIAIYNAGRFLIKGPDVLSDSTIMTLPTESRYITVTWPKTMKESDTMALEPIKEIMEEPAQLSDYWLYLVALLLLLAIAAYMYYRKKYKKEKVEIATPEPEVVIPAHIIALEALKNLELQQLWQQGLIKEYQTELTSIIRSYIERRYLVHAQKMTTEELVFALKPTSLSEEHKSELRQILNVADLVKFAKAQPETNIHDLFMDKAKLFVEQTQSPFGETNVNLAKE